MRQMGAPVILAIVSAARFVVPVAEKYRTTMRGAARFVLPAAAQSGNEVLESVKKRAPAASERLISVRRTPFEWLGRKAVRGSFMAILGEKDTGEKRLAVNARSKNLFGAGFRFST